MKNLIILLLFFSALGVFAQKPKIWIYTDMTDNTLPGNNHMGTINDPDDISAMAGYLLMANSFETKGIVVGSTHRKEHKTTPHQGEWANEFWCKAYQQDVMNLNKNIGGFPDNIEFVQSCIKESAEKYNADKKYTSLEDYSTVKALFDLVDKEIKIYMSKQEVDNKASNSRLAKSEKEEFAIVNEHFSDKRNEEVGALVQARINVLCWGSLTEPAILVKHCLTVGRQDILDNLRFIAHWTNSPWRQGSPEHPEDVANCREDADACAYLKLMALNGFIEYYECGAIGQHGIVSGSPKGEEYFNPFKASALGQKFVGGKYVHNSVDHSDAATYWVLLENWGVGLNDIKSNGTNPPEVEKANEAKFKQWSERIHNELLRRSNAASGIK